MNADAYLSTVLYGNVRERVCVLISLCCGDINLSINSHIVDISKAIKGLKLG